MPSCSLYRIVVIEQVAVLGARGEAVHRAHRGVQRLPVHAGNCKLKFNPRIINARPVGSLQGSAKSGSST